jgi:hypothetical protein
MSLTIVIVVSRCGGRVPDAAPAFFFLEALSMAGPSGSQ